MNHPVLQTERLLLRRFVPEDLPAVYEIYRDPQTNRFLPWFPLKTREEAEEFYRTHIQSCYEKDAGWYYAICQKEEPEPVGYVSVSAGEAFELGYGLLSRFWHKGIASEAAAAVVELLRREGAPFLIATHDRSNPRSGSVMQRLGMRYQYSYEEQWQPKDLPVIFRLYQLNLDGRQDRVFLNYWNGTQRHFVETQLRSSR